MKVFRLFGPLRLGSKSHGPGRFGLFQVSAALPNSPAMQRTRQDHMGAEKLLPWAVIRI